MDLLDVVARYVAPAVVGCTSVVFAPWVKWQLDKHRDRRESRKRLIETVRRELLGSDVQHTSAFAGLTDFQKTSAYAQLRPHLSERAKSFLEPEGDKPGIMIVVGRSNEFSRTLLSDEVDRLEKLWGLI